MKKKTVCAHEERPTTMMYVPLANIQEVLQFTRRSTHTN